MQPFFQNVFLNTLMKQSLLKFYFSFPIQLFILHLRSNFLLLLIWLLLFLTVTGGFGRSMGFNFLFLDPEYMGKVDFWSFFIIGLTFGIFAMAWNTTTYILNSHRFPFLATLNRPYGKYSINNFILPTIFIGLYLYLVVDFQWFNEFAEQDSIVQDALGFVFGIITIVLVSIFYFHFTNKDLVLMGKPRSKMKIPSVLNALGVKNQRKIIEDARLNPYRSALRVDFFLNEWFRPRIVRSVRHYNFAQIQKVFQQNHTNALIIQSLSISLLILMSALVEYEFCRIPAAASVLILFSIFTTIVGALTYWLQEWRTVFIVFMLILVDKMMSFGWFYYENKAYGLNYTNTPAQYTYSNLEKLAASNYQNDMVETQKILNKWRSQFNYNPPLVVICVSGGGLRAALWAMQSIRESDKITGGNLLKHTVLMTGASGGMLGAAYYRELYHQRQLGAKINPNDERYLRNVSKDLANALTFTYVVNDIFIPWINRKVNGHIYRQDRGYIFEQQLIENSEGLLKNDLNYYRKPEQNALIPMMFLTPVIVNDSRTLYISPQKVSYMMKAPFTLEDGDGSFAEIDGVDFGALFKNNDAYNMRFASALRMNATYPYVLPSVYLPTNTSVEVIDAGFRDNFGTESGTRFLAVFRDWIRQNTREVIIIQVRSSAKITEIPKERNRSLADNFNVFSSIMDVENQQDFHHDSYIGYLKSKLGYNKVHLLRYIYQPTLIEERASLSFHLTQREKNDVMNAIYLEENQKTLRRLQQLLKPRYTASRDTTTVATDTSQLIINNIQPVDSSASGSK